MCYNKIAVKILIVGDKEIYVTLIYWNGGGCSDTLKKGGVFMDYIQMILTIAITALLIELIKTIKK